MNYRIILEKELDKIQKDGKIPVLMLHACCAPCSSYVLKYLTQYFEILIYFYNPNICDADEYDRRLSELIRLVNEMPLKNNARVIDGGYEPNYFKEIAQGLENEPERGERCRKCIAQRLRKTGETAAQMNADYFTTTLTVSPHKDSEFINSAGKAISVELGIPYLFSDFKKRDGYKRSIELSSEYNLYRQNFCGCTYSHGVRI